MKKKKKKHAGINYINTSKLSIYKDGKRIADCKPYTLSMTYVPSKPKLVISIEGNTITIDYTP